VKRAALPSLRRPLRVKPARSNNHAGPLDETDDKTPSDCSASGQIRKRGRAPPQASDYSVSSELPEEVHGTRIRLWGIDAPESSQLCRNDESLLYRCGAKAANELDTFIARRPVECSPVSLDQYGRTVAVCSIDGVDLAEWLVRNGLALDWPTYSKGKYAKAQSEADYGGRGIWVGSYVAPWLFRACIRQGGRPGDCSDDANMHP
jgi:endonuclease YncB( thermonuclease family)